MCDGVIFSELAEFKKMTERHLTKGQLYGSLDIADYKFCQTKISRNFLII